MKKKFDDMFLEHVAKHEHRDTKNCAITILGEMVDVLAEQSERHTKLCQLMCERLDRLESNELTPKNND